jgi:hypothetical protein
MGQLLALLGLAGPAFRLLRNLGIDCPRWPPTREGASSTRNVDPTAALAAIPALAIGHALFGAQ